MEKSLGAIFGKIPYIHDPWPNFGANFTESNLA